MLASVIIRTFNEQRYLEELLVAVRNQKLVNLGVEVVVVDSGSTDNTLQIAEKYDCRITHIKKEDFTFGRSLNVGCEFSNGDFLVFISGHCIPVNDGWLEMLIKPLREEVAVYSYGKQVGRDTTKFSEYRLFDKYYPDYSKLPQDGYFCNNANSAICRNIWDEYQFNEELTGLEDMFLAKRLVGNGLKIAYSAGAPVFHVHDEKWSSVKVRYEREAYALHQIMPGIHFTFGDFLKYFFASVLQDSGMALQQGCLLSKLVEIIRFRYCHYWGTYCGHHEHRKLSQKMKYKYFYPKDLERNNYEKKGSGVIADEGQ